MLESIHKHMSWIMWAIVVLITVTFLFFGIYPSNVSGRSVAKVGGEVITLDEYNRVYRTMYDNYKQVLKDAVQRVIREKPEGTGPAGTDLGKTAGSGGRAYRSEGQR